MKENKQSIMVTASYKFYLIFLVSLSRTYQNNKNVRSVELIGLVYCTPKTIRHLNFRNNTRVN